jgi:hypothetical protein
VESGFDSQQRNRFNSPPKRSDWLQSPSSLLYNDIMATGDCSLVAKTNHPSPSNDKVKSGETIPPLPDTFS